MSTQQSESKNARSKKKVRSGRESATDKKDSQRKTGKSEKVRYAVVGLETSHKRLFSRRSKRQSQTRL